MCKYGTVILDDIGYVPQSREEVKVLFTLLAERDERGSVLIASNLPFSNRETILTEQDQMPHRRLLHHCANIELINSQLPDGRKK